MNKRLIESVPEFDGWFREHLENFVKPYLGYIPQLEIVYDMNHPANYWVNRMNRRTVNATVAIWLEAKRRLGDRPILLAGRDAWLFEVLARVDGTPTIFRPDISSYTKDHPSLKGIYKNYALLDSGNRGSVPFALGIKHFLLVYTSGPIYRKNRSNVFFTPLQQKRWKELHQVFPHQRNIWARQDSESHPLRVYNLLEGLPKYWTQASVDALGKITQAFDSYSFESAALTTMHFVKMVIEKEYKP